MKSKGTILYIGGFELPDRNAAAHRVLNNAKAFRELGYNVVFCGVDKESSENSKEPQTVCGFKSFPMKYPASTKQWVLQMLDINHYVSVLNSIDDIRLIICYNLHAVPLMRMQRIAGKRNIRIVADCTEWYDNKASMNPVEMIKFIDTQLCMRLLQKRCNGMIAISTYLEGYYKRFINEITVVPPLVDITDEKWLQEPTAKNEKISFVYSGQPGDTKDKIGQIIDCFLQTGQADKCYFKVIGLTQEQFYKAYPEFEAKKTEIQGFAKFVGRVPHYQSIAELKNADYCIFIRDRSRKNMAGFPTKFVECYTSGVSIIANEISDIKSYFPNDAYSILIEENTDENIVNAINKAFQNGRPPKRSNEKNPFDYHCWLNKLLVFLN